MKSGHMYMMPLDSPWYALMPTRIWYKPWRWNLHGALLHEPVGASAVYDSYHVSIASNIRRDELTALMQIMGAENRATTPLIAGMRCYVASKLGAYNIGD